MNNNDKNLIKLNCEDTFKINCKFDIFGFKNSSTNVPNIDDNYIFDSNTTNAILAGFI
jgi:hypothetical protein